MAVFRVPKIKDYTVMANRHLRDHTLSLKAKGLLSLMLSLPEDWDYTLRGLSSISREGLGSIGAAVRELEGGGYIERRQIRDGKGHFMHWEYTILESPQRQNPDTGNPDLENPDTGKPDAGKPDTEKPDTENPEQLNTKILNTKESKKELQSTELTNIYPSYQEEGEEELFDEPDDTGLPRASPPDGNDGMDGIGKREAYERLIKRNIDYDILISSNPYSQPQIDGFIELMLDTLNCRSPTIMIGGSEIPAEVVKSRLLKLDMGHIQYVLDSMQNNSTKITNIRKYLLAALYNAPSTINSYYVNRVNHDMRRRDGKTSYDRYGNEGDYSFELGESL